MLLRFLRTHIRDDSGDPPPCLEALKAPHCSCPVLCITHVSAGTVTKGDAQSPKRIVAESRVGEKAGEVPALASATPAEK